MKQPSMSDKDKALKEVIRAIEAGAVGDGKHFTAAFGVAFLNMLKRALGKPEEAPSTVPPDDHLHGSKEFRDRVVSLVEEFSGPDWDLTLGMMVGILEVIKIDIVLAGTQK